ncbi:MAG: FAD-dependent oxidoreductase, partial [Acidobacteria bacterium]|nr:FAD-dependent oxidoreductase [Acidobacteriota bacterium]
LGTWSLMTTELLSLREKIEAARLLSGLSSIDTESLDRVSLAEWLASVTRSQRVRQLLATIVRVTTYTNDAALLSAGAAITQVRLGLEGNVDYLDGGWQTLVDSALEVARKAGVQVLTNASVTTIRREGEHYTLHLRSGETHQAKFVVLAASPRAVLSMVEGVEDTVLHRRAQEAAPVKAACLDVALTSLPNMESGLFALGLDRPLYCIVHSVSAKLAPEGGAVIHVMKNHSADEETDARADRRELEELLDMMQPGWRERVAHVRFLPNITVSNAIVMARHGGTKGRPGPQVPGMENLYVAGDWVGDEGMLLDASVASAHHAAQLVLKRRDEAGDSLASSQQTLRLIA